MFCLSSLCIFNLLILPSVYIFVKLRVFTFKGNVEHLMLINITIQTFKSENELELSLSKWDAVKDKFMPLFEDRGLKRYSITRIWNKKEQYQLGHIFEYKDEDSLKDCLPIWNDIEKQFKDKIQNITTGYRGVLIDDYNF